jgi:hypothetical protein
MVKRLLPRNVDPVICFSMIKLTVTSYVLTVNRKTQVPFLCTACDHEERADIHAAKNILAWGCAVWNERSAAGHAASVHGEDLRRPKVAVSVKWKPTEEVLDA